MIRQPAAEKLARQLLGIRPARLSPLSDEFFTATAKIIMAHVVLDEQRQRSEQLAEGLAAQQPQNGGDK